MNYSMSNTIELPDKIDAKESDYLYIKESQLPNAGNGLFTALQIFKNEIISFFRGEILSDEEADIRAKSRSDGYFINMLDGTILDSMNVNCFAKYANDSQGYEKTSFSINSYITVDEEENVCLVTLRDILKGEEIFCSYGHKYWKKYRSSEFSI